MSREREHRTVSGPPRVLFLSHVLPFPADSGAAIRTSHLLRGLSARFDVTALCLGPAARRGRGAERTQGDRGERPVELGSQGTEPVGLDPAGVSLEEHPRAASAANSTATHLRSLWHRRSWVTYRNHAPALLDRLHELTRRERFDLVHVDSLDLVAYLPALPPAPRVCGHHNVESVLLRRRAEAEPNPMKRGYLRWQAGLLERDERRWCPEVALNVVVSAEDASTLQRIAPRSNVTVCPNGVDTEHYRPKSASQRGLVFVGAYDWFPNRDAAEFFSQEVLPLLRRMRSDVPVTWVGRTPDAERRRYGALGVHMPGYVADERPAIRSAACFVVPLRVGGGTRIKILTAWAMGRAVVTTSIGCEGLDARHGENVLIADDPKSFADAINRVLGDESLRVGLERSGRETATRLYDWSRIVEPLADEYERLAKGWTL